MITYAYILDEYTIICKQIFQYTWNHQPADVCWNQSASGHQETSAKCSPGTKSSCSAAFRTPHLLTSKATMLPWCGANRSKKKWCNNYKHLRTSTNYKHVKHVKLYGTRSKAETSPASRDKPHLQAHMVRHHSDLCVLDTKDGTSAGRFLAPGSPVAASDRPTAFCLNSFQHNDMDILWYFVDIIETFKILHAQWRLVSSERTNGPCS